MKYRHWTRNLRACVFLVSWRLLYSIWCSPEAFLLFSCLFSAETNIPTSSKVHFKLHTVGKGWNEASDVCQMDGGRLVRVDGVSKKHVLKSYIDVWKTQGHMYVILTHLLLNTKCPVLANSIDPDQLDSSEANWSWSALFVIEYVNFYQKPGSSNLIGWKLEVGVAFSFIQQSDWLEIRSGRGFLIYSAMVENVHSDMYAQRR